MSTDDSGIYDLRKLRPERAERPRTAFTVTWSVAAGLFGAAVSWGVTTQRLTDIERRIDSLTIDERQIEAAVSTHDTKIEVDRAQYAEIIRRLDDLNAKVEHIK